MLIQPHAITSEVISQATHIIWDPEDPLLLQGTTEEVALTALENQSITHSSRKTCFLFKQIAYEGLKEFSRGALISVISWGPGVGLLASDVNEEWQILGKYLTCTGIGLTVILGVLGAYKGYINSIPPE